MKLLTAGLAATIAFAAPAFAATHTINFDGLASGALSDDVGDTAEVNVTNRTVVDFGNQATVFDSVSLWTDTSNDPSQAGYRGLSGVVTNTEQAITLNNDEFTAGEFRFDIAAGYEMSFDSVDYTGYTTPDGRQLLRDISFRIYDESWNELYSHDVIAPTTADFYNPTEADYVAALGPATLAPGISGLTGTVYFQWGQDWDMGIDNIRYTTSIASGGSAPVVPLPATLPLMIAAMGGLGFMRRRKG